MGNQHSVSHAAHKPRKNVHWKSAGRPTAPGKPHITPILSDDEPNAITLKWAPPTHDGGAPLQGYQVECNRLGTPVWIRTSPPIVSRPELVLTGLGPPHRYQFRVAALNIVGCSKYSEVSDILTINADRGLQEAPTFLQHLEDVTILENEKTEFRVVFTGKPTPTIAWFKDDYEIFSSRRTAITSDESTSVLVFHQTLSSDEGEIKCTATNRLGHSVTRAQMILEAAPKLRYPRQYEDGLLYEINETVFLKTTIVGKPTPTIEWRHDGQLIVVNDRVELTNTGKFSMLKIHSARRSDRGEYQVQARNNIGEDTAAFLVTITAPPDPPRQVSVTRQVDKSVTLDWEPPEDDGGCRIGNYIVEYYRSGWNVWLKATTSRKTSVTLFDLIEGSEYRFRVKAESPYGMSAPSIESAPVLIPGRSVDMEFLAVESQIINKALMRENKAPVSPAPRRKKNLTTQPSSTEPLASPELPPKQQTQSSYGRDASGSNEFMLVLYHDHKSADKAEKRKSFQLDLEDALSPPPLSLSAPELSSRCLLPFKALRNAVSSTELLHERALARFYKAVAMKEEQSKQKQNKLTKHDENNKTDIPYKPDNDCQNITEIKKNISSLPTLPTSNMRGSDVFIKTNSLEDKVYKYNPKQISQDPQASENKWQQMSFDEDYTASTVSTDEEYSDEGSLNQDVDRDLYVLEEEDTYNPRDKIVRTPPIKESLHREKEESDDEQSEHEKVKLSQLPDPNFIPKPILKRRECDNSNKKSSTKELSKAKSKKEEKITLLKRITKKPLQTSFPFPKILSKKEVEKKQEQNQKINIKNESKKEKENDNINEEGRTVIDYYGNIVKEYGSPKKSTTSLYFKTEDLKNVAEKQKIINLENSSQRYTNKTNEINSFSSNRFLEKLSENKEKPSKVKIKQKKTTEKEISLKEQFNSLLCTSEKKQNITVTKPKEKSINKIQSKLSQDTQIVLKKTERATIVIPIDYQKLEERAKMNVRSAIDYTVDICLLLLAFWVYFFNDERLAIPFLILIIYRQLQETLLLNIPEWLRLHTPEWLAKKAS